uniref:Cytochrome b6-f complex subunit 6 n=2 Tax=Welwitschia mirabilis TaxID=3377 RepID=PETL_WELMI|nr:cytochrome b6/f complex subunit VI [Welwitschia mirabilis]B2Y1X7.1 RecName: Full=Cytochrome b6-f complex subunit 6; AltName: Full=Cytochrome b6-f complex subunit PetL; AltName: Full=Cytochrome b6-f complex subunit VI [Welwitschia mirabilis]ABY26807.1 cytochrome b6/f complex subunit VI [Welwitschia mirabilis]AMA21024.1 cytochrome b6/f complex subunit VI [Welwitschia mirabilis]BAH11211.1 cytochrome b/f complex 3.5 kDa subunit [Welwitschia mirabilis]
MVILISYFCFLLVFFLFTLILFIGFNRIRLI